MTESQTIRLGPYELVEQIAQGAYGEVYRARHVGPAGFQRVLAIKRLKRHVMADPDAVRAFENEARIGGLLQHHNITQTLEFDQHGGHYYLAMEYVDGVSFQDIIAVFSAQKRHVPEPVALELAAQACDGLHYAHEARTPEGVPLNLVHRDIKPSNLMLTRSGVVKVMDFGIARVDNQTLTDAGFIKGTPRYLSPEVISGSDGIDRRSDLFSLGTVLYELLALKYLFDAPNLLTLMSKVREAAVKPQLKELSRRHPGTAKLLKRVLTSEPDKRFATAREMARELRQLRRRLSDDDVDLEAFASEVIEAQSRDSGKRGRATASRPARDGSDSGAKRGERRERPGASMPGEPAAPGPQAPPASTRAPAAPRPGEEPNPRFTPRFGSRSLAKRPPVLPDVKLKTTSITVDQLMAGWGKPVPPRPSRVDLRETDPGPIRRRGAPPRQEQDEPALNPGKRDTPPSTDSSAGKLQPGGQSHDRELEAAANLLPDGLPDGTQTTPSPIPGNMVTSLFSSDPGRRAGPPPGGSPVPGEGTTRPDSGPPAPPSSARPATAAAEEDMRPTEQMVLPGPSSGEWDPDLMPTHMIDLRALKARHDAGKGTESLAPASATRPPAPAGSGQGAVSPAPGRVNPEMGADPHGHGAGGEKRAEQEAEDELPPPSSRAMPEAVLKTQPSTSLDNWNSDFDEAPLPAHRQEELSATVARPPATSNRESYQLGFGMAASILDEDTEGDVEEAETSPLPPREEASPSTPSESSAPSGGTSPRPARAAGGTSPPSPADRPLEKRPPPPKQSDEDREPATAPIRKPIARAPGAGSEDRNVKTPVPGEQTDGFEPTAALPYPDATDPDAAFVYEPTAAAPVMLSDMAEEPGDFEPTAVRPVNSRASAQPENNGVLEPTALRPPAGVNPGSDGAGDETATAPTPAGTPTPPSPPSQGPDPFADMPPRAAELPTQVLPVSPGVAGHPVHPSIPAPGANRLEPEGKPRTELGMKFNPNSEFDPWQRPVFVGAGLAVLAIIAVILFALIRW